MWFSTTRTSAATYAVALCIAIGCVDISLAEELIDPAAEKIVRQMSEFYQGLNSFSVDVNYELEASVSDEESAAYHDGRHVAMARPNRLVVTPSRDAEGIIVCDGEELLVHLPSMGRYLLEDAPGDFDAVLQQEATLFMGGGRTAVQLAAADPYSQFTESVTALSLLEPKPIDSVACHRVEAIQEGLKTILWIQAGDRPLLRKMEWEFNVEPAEGDDQSTAALELPRPVVTLNNWAIDTEIATDTFAVNVPEDAEQVASLLMAEEPDVGPHPLLGMDAPDAELLLLDGKSQALADHEDKKVVVLDFWALWCAPCIEALPSLASVAKKFADRDVAFYAVNVGDEEADIKEFLKQKELDLPVAMDAEGTISDHFGAEMIPQTVIIDKQGTVQVVRVGLTGDLAEALAEEIEAVLAGKQLAEAALDAAREAQRLGDEIPAGPDAVTSKNLLTDTHAFNRRTTIDAYQEHGSHDPAWDEGAIAFLAEIARYFSQAEGFKSAPELMAMAEPLVAKGCDDPLVLYCYGAVLQDANNGQESNEKAAHQIEESYAGLVERGYPANRCLAAANRVRRKANQVEDQAEKVQKFRDLAREHAIAMILQDDVNNNEGRILATLLIGFTNGLSFEGRAEFYEAAKVHQDLQPWLVNLLGGKYHVEAAWAARGGGWAMEVTEEGWQGFSEHIEQARQCYERAWEAAPSRPEAPAEMITIAMGSGTLREMRMWFDRAVGAQLDYRPAYYNLLYGMLPRWHGDHELMYQFGLECVNTQRYDTDVPYMLCEALWRIAKDDHNALGTRYLQRSGIYENVQTVCERHIARDTSPTDRANWWKTVSLGFAFLTEHWDDARNILDESEANLNLDALGRFPLDRDEVVASVRLRTGPHAEAFLEALSWADNGREEEAIARLTELMRDDDIHPLALLQLRSRVQTLRWLTAFESGDAVDLMPAANLSGWNVTAGNWTIQPDGSLRGVSDNQGVVLTCLGTFGSSWELSGEIEYGESPYNAWDAGVLFYNAGKARYAVLFNPTKQWVAAGTYRALKENQTPYEHEGKVVPFVVRLQDGVVDVWIDNTQVVAEKEFTGWTDRQPIEVAIGAKYRWEGAVLTYRNLKIELIEPAD